MEEVWKPVVGYEDLYEVSSMGRIRGLRGKNGKSNTRKVFLMSLVINKSSKYLAITVGRKGDKQKNMLVHRLVAQAFIPNPGSKPEVNHINGVKIDNKVENLEWVTLSENHKHAYKIGLQTPMRGNHPMAKLSLEKVQKIKSMIRSGVTVRTIVEIFNVSSKLISDIKCGRRWGWVEEEVTKKK